MITMLRMIFFEREAPPPSEKVHAEVRALGFLLFVLLASLLLSGCGGSTSERVVGGEHVAPGDTGDTGCAAMEREVIDYRDRKSTRLNSSHVRISYAVFCLKKKKK